MSATHRSPHKGETAECFPLPCGIDSAPHRLGANIPFRQQPLGVRADAFVASTSLALRATRPAREQFFQWIVGDSLRLVGPLFPRFRRDDEARALARGVRCRFSRSRVFASGPQSFPFFAPRWPMFFDHKAASLLLVVTLAASSASVACGGTAPKSSARAAADSGASSQSTYSEDPTTSEYDGGSTFSGDAEVDHDGGAASNDAGLDGGPIADAGSPESSSRGTFACGGLTCNADVEFCAEYITTGINPTDVHVCTPLAVIPGSCSTVGLPPNVECNTTSCTESNGQVTYQCTKEGYAGGGR